MQFKDFFEQNEKTWSAKKDEILQYWNSLHPDTPITMTPMDTQSDISGNHRSFSYDGLRITGSSSFVLQILSRLKDLLVYESDITKLRLVFREIDSPRRADPTKRSFVFYANLEPRKHGKPGRKAFPFTPKKFPL